MSSWTAFYINTTHTEAVVEKLKSLSGIEKITQGEYPKDLYNNYLFGHEKPDFMAIGKTQLDWTTVWYNNFSRLVDWATEFSQTLNCRVIVILAQNTSDAYYFALYEGGKKLREIEVCYSEDMEPVNWGEKFSFEADEVGILTNHGYLFDFDALEEYSIHFGLKLQTDYDQVSWYTMKGEGKRFTVNDYINKHLKPKKPWWQFW